MPNNNVQWDRGQPIGETIHHFKNRKKPHIVKVLIGRAHPVYIAKKYSEASKLNYSKAALKQLASTAKTL